MAIYKRSSAGTGDECIAFGAVPKIINVVPGDIEIPRNYGRKELSLIQTTFQPKATPKSSNLSPKFPPQ
jgi:hypothetical protein